MTDHQDGRAMGLGSPGPPPTKGQAEAGPLICPAADPSAETYERCATMARFLSDRPAAEKACRFCFFSCRFSEAGFQPRVREGMLLSRKCSKELLVVRRVGCEGT